MIADPEDVEIPVAFQVLDVADDDLLVIELLTAKGKELRTSAIAALADDVEFIIRRSIDVGPAFDRGSVCWADVVLLIEF